uniref:hypothetical protein n=1 Tax=Aliarcobacter sp. TaxID=2321116 RepID=UPI0040481914
MIVKVNLTSNFIQFVTNIITLELEICYFFAMFDNYHKNIILANYSSSFILVRRIL